jgi:hypothetical protein
MPQSKWAPSIIPGEDQTVYLVLNDFGHRGMSWRETDVKDTELEAVITDLLEGQYNNPVRVVSFNSEEGWARNVSEDVADEIRRRCDLQMTEVPPNLEDFVERHESRDRGQLTLRLS